MALAPAKVGVIGCGAISAAYLRQCPEFKILRLAACADLLPERAQARAEEFGVPQAVSPEELLADPEIEIVVNLTVPQAHYEVALAAVQAGKSVWNEKPLTLTREEGRSLLAAAEEQGVLVGCAPDTFLGGGHQTCVKLIDEGAIGAPVACTAFMVGHGHETWHSNPEFYYKPGGGPMFDMGPYYLTALVNMLGPVRRVTASTSRSFEQRLITSEPYAGKVVDVEVATHVAGLMDFACGAVGTMITSFDVWSHHLPLLEVHGTEGSLSLPDPNGPGGRPQLWRRDTGQWQDVPLTHGYAATSRSIGVADMAYAIRTGRPHRASGRLAYHVLDLMHSFHDASDQGQHILLESTVERPAPLPEGLRKGQLDE